MELAVAAFNQLGLRLLIVGEGPDERRLKKMARGNIEFIPWQSVEALKGYYSNCRALIFPGEEDFGIVPVEAQACGKPVIAYGKGGALETVAGAYADEAGLTYRKSTGIFFREQKVASLTEAVKAFQMLKFDPSFIRQNTLRFEAQLFKKRLEKFVQEKLREHKKIFG